MPAPEGNKFWLNRAKHGPDIIFNDPKVLWECACEYFEWCTNTPLLSEDFIKGGDYAGTKVDIKKMRPFTIQGLCIYLGVNAKYFNELEHLLSQKEDKNSKDITYVITCIREIIYNQKFEGASAGLLNHNIIARDLGLTDKKDYTSGGKGIMPPWMLPVDNKEPEVKEIKPGDK